MIKARPRAETLETAVSNPRLRLKHSCVTPGDETNPQLNTGVSPLESV